MKSALNPSHAYAVMAQRIDAKDSLDDFPTPPWATRALLEHVVENVGELRSQTCLEPACGAGHMSKVLEEYFGSVSASDVHPYGYGDVVDFTSHPVKVGAFDWIITNPPFRLGEDFIVKSLAVARVGVAMLTRTVFIESIGRYSRIFNVTPPTKVAQFVERVPMVKGRLDPKASTATGYCSASLGKTKTDAGAFGLDTTLPKGIRARTRLRTTTQSIWVARENCARAGNSRNV